MATRRPGHQTCDYPLWTFDNLLRAPTRLRRFGDTLYMPIRIPTATIACDESGSEGENVTGAAHPVFVHAAVFLSRREASSIVNEVRQRAPSQAQEYKAEHLLRRSSVDAVKWLLSEAGVAGRASAYLVDKSYFVVGKVVDLIVEELTHEQGSDLYSTGIARSMAMNLSNSGPATLGPDWPPLLAAFNSLARAKQRRGTKTSVAEFYETVEKVYRLNRKTAAGGALRLILLGRRHAEALAANLYGSDRMPPALDPLFAALPQTIRSWHSRLSRPIRVVHDRQAALTVPRVEAMIAELRSPFPEFASLVPPTSVEGILQVDSRDDPRIQVADLVAGIARAVAQDALAGRVDWRTPLVRGMVDPHSLWSDDSSWRVLSSPRN